MTVGTKVVIGVVVGSKQQSASVHPAEKQTTDPGCGRNFKAGGQVKLAHVGVGVVVTMGVGVVVTVVMITLQHLDAVHAPMQITFFAIEPGRQVKEAQVGVGVVVMVVVGNKQQVMGVHMPFAQIRRPGCGRKTIVTGQAKPEHVGAGVVVTVMAGVVVIVGIKQQIAGVQPPLAHMRRPGCGRNVIDSGQVKVAHVRVAKQHADAVHPPFAHTTLLGWGRNVKPAGQEKLAQVGGGADVDVPQGLWAWLS